MAEKSWDECTTDLRAAQESEHDIREITREADHFLNKRDGQWEPQIINIVGDRPRYTFDECTPIVDDIMGEIETCDFDISVDPAGGQASKDIANAYEGIIRQIENISNARFHYEAAARIMVGTGVSGWRVATGWREGSWQQDLMIKPIPSFNDTVWFDPNATLQTMEDAEFCWLLTSITRAAYEKKYGKERTPVSVTVDKKEQVYTHKKPDEVVIGEYLYKKQMQRLLVQMTDGSVFEVDDDFMKIKDELSAAGVEVHKERKAPYHVVYQRLFDGSDWLTEAKDSVFSWLPVVPVYGNFKISENKVIYFGAVEKLMDPQRIINYAESRKVEEGALAPKAKVWLTKDQATSPDVRNTLRTLNTNNDPVQFYDYEEGQPAPAYMQGPMVNQGLAEQVQSSQNFIQRASGTYDEARGTAPAQRSGKAIGRLQDKSDNPKRKWFRAMEIALTHTCRIMMDAAPKVYDTTQEMVMLGPDRKTTDTITIKQRVVDEETGAVVEINDLSKGKYEVSCSAGPAFTSRQQETVESIYELAGLDPSIMQIGADVLLNNISTPGIDLIAERKRLQMVKAGLIPESQLTDEEKEMVAQAQNTEGQQPDPMALMAQAEMIKAQTKAETEALKIELEQNKLLLKQMELQMRGQNDQNRAMIDSVKTLNEQIRIQAETLKAIREATGADMIADPVAGAAFHEQAKDLHTSIVNS